MPTLRLSLKAAALPWIVSSVFAAAVVAQAPSAKAATSATPMRLVPLRDGLRDIAPKRDLSKVAEIDEGKLAAAVGVDLLKNDNPLLAANYAKGRLFYLFYKTTENAFGDRPWLIQRIKKTERTWGPDATKPEEKVTWQVEVFKLMTGALKRPDQHHGSFPLRDGKRREILKEYEIGFGELPGKAVGTAWPFRADRLFEMVQPYQEEPGEFPKVVFATSRTWTLAVAFAADGTWSVASPELGFAAPKTWPAAKAAEPLPDPASRDVVLEPGKGLPGAVVGATAAADLEKALGAPVEDVESGKGHRLLSFPRSVSVNVSPDGTTNTILTRPGFEGRSKQGLRHGMTRAAAKKLLAGKDLDDAAEQWDTGGMLVDFDANDRVRRLVITKPK